MMDDLPGELETIRDFVRWGATSMAAAGLSHGHGMDSALDEAAYLAAWVTRFAPRLPDSMLDARLTADERRRLAELLRRRVEDRVPAAYLTGETWFAGLRFAVDERVLIPRSPIAELIEGGFQPWLTADNPRILDLCTGSGCIAIACAVWLDAEVDAADISPAALAVAQANAREHHAAVRFLQSDLFDALAGVGYDLIVSNPPYVPDEEWHSLPPEFHHEPDLALRSGPDGLDIPLRILDQAAAHLNEGGVLVMELGSAAPALEELLPKLPVTWLDFERGGAGVLLVSRDELRASRDELRAAVKGRGGDGQ